MKPGLTCSLYAVLAAVTAGCDDGIGPEGTSPPLQGVYALVSIEGRRPPATFVLHESEEITVMADTVRFVGGRQWARRTLVRSRSLVTGFTQYLDLRNQGDASVLADGRVVLSFGPCDDSGSCLPPDTTWVVDTELQMARSATLYFLEDLVFRS